MVQPNTNLPTCLLIYLPSGLPSLLSYIPFANIYQVRTVYQALCWGYRGK